MKHDACRALEDDVRGDFHLPLLRLDTGSGRDVYLGTALADGALAVLVLHPADGGERKLDVLRELCARDGIGITRCPACAAVETGWPGFCAACGNELRRAAAQAGAATGDDVREMLGRQWPGSRLLGSLPRAEGIGAMCLVQGRGILGLTRGPVVGMAFDRDDAGATLLVPCWAMDEATLERFRANHAARVRRARAAPAVAAGMGVARPPDGTPAGEGDKALPLRRRREIRWAGVALLLLMFGVLAFRSFTTIAGGDGQPAAGPPPKLAPIIVTGGPTDSIPVAPPPTDSVPPKDVRGGRRGPVPPVDSVDSVDTAPPPPPAPDAAVDRAEVERVARAFGRAFRTKNIQLVRTAYPGISPGEEQGWRRWFRNPYDLRLKFVLDHGPFVDTDSAAIGFTLALRYAREQECMVFNAQMVRTGDGWSLHRLTRGLRDDPACEDLHQNWDRIPDP